MNYAISSCTKHSNDYDINFHSFNSTKIKSHCKYSYKLDSIKNKEKKSNQFSNLLLINIATLKYLEGVPYFIIIIIKYIMSTKCTILQQQQ